MSQDPSTSEAEARIVEFLKSPALHGGETPQHVETHLSHLFLGPDDALKLKKRVAWSVVDYTSLAAREHFCRRELEINAPNAPEIYIDVEPVIDGPDGLSLGRDADAEAAGEGEVVDFVLRMRRFPDRAQLDRVVDAGIFTAALAEATADAIAAMHRRAPPVRRRDHAEHVAGLLEQLARDVSAEVGEAGAADVAAWARSCRMTLAACARRIDARARHGFVRRCHGDLHLSNLCLWHGSPVAFDALEFSEDIATIDVMYDLAFVLIDLEHRGHADRATLLLSRYLQRTRDYGALALAPLCKSLRHMVRALVGARKGRDVAAHIAAARALLAPRLTPGLVAIGGPSGTGKSTVARALSAETGAVVLRSDVARKLLFGCEPEDPLPPEAYTHEISRHVYRRLMVDARRALVAGASVILDATFLAPAERDLARDLAGVAGASFCGIFLEAPPAVLQARVAARRADASDADADVVARQMEDGFGPIDWTRLDAERPAGKLAREIAAMA